MTPPKAVVFDLGKVLLDFDYDIAVAKVQQHCRLTIAELRQLIDQSPLLHRYESNLVSTAQFFAEICAASGFSKGITEFRSMFSDIFSPIPPMIALHAQLRAQHIPTYIFSNTNEIAVEHIRNRFPFFKEFDGHILSYEHQAMKPDPKLYEVVERYASHSGPDLLYIDDRGENILAGQQRGWRTILHRASEETIAAVRETGLLRKA